MKKLRYSPEAARDLENIKMQVSDEFGELTAVKTMKRIGKGIRTLEIAENANEKNLITGTRYMNVEGMLPFENMVADYVKETGNHVLYRVAPVFEGQNLLAAGVQMEAYSVEDEGDGIF